jgi:hypothetical protein
MKNPTNKITLAALLGRPPQDRAILRLNPDQLKQIDLGSASVVKSLLIGGIPNNWCITSFEKSGSHWKISVFGLLDDSSREEQDIWNAALRLATGRLGKKMVKRKDGEWIQRLWLPLHRDGDVAIEFVSSEVAPVIAEARQLLSEFAASVPKASILGGQ